MKAGTKGADMPRKGLRIAVILLPVLLSLACGQSGGPAGQPTYTDYPTYTPYPTSDAGGSGPANRVVPDLAYIKILVVPYTDDADQEYEGLALNIEFRDTKSQAIPFSGVPLTVDIEFTGYPDAVAALGQKNGRVVFRKTVAVDHSMRLDEVFGNYIRISFEEMSVDPRQIYRLGNIVVTVHTPEQGDFVSDYNMPVQLYP
jgi:hypothetical protein